MDVVLKVGFLARPVRKLVSARIWPRCPRGGQSAPNRGPSHLTTHWESGAGENVGAEERVGTLLSIFPM